MHRRFSRGILAWALVSCASASQPGGGGGGSPPALDAWVPEGECLKISWLRFTGARRQVDPASPSALQGAIAVTAEYSVVLSYGWLRRFGPRMREPWLARVQEEWARVEESERRLKPRSMPRPFPIIVGFSDAGYPDEQVRDWIRRITAGGVVRRISAFPAESIDTAWAASLLRKDLSNADWNLDARFVRFVTIASEKESKTFFCHAYRNDEAALSQYWKLEERVAAILSLHAPRAVAVTDQEWLR